MIEPIELTYDLHLLPPGRISFRRWRYELWHGQHLLAAGWRLNTLHAQRALRVHAMRYAHRVLGLHPLRPDMAADPERPWGDRPVSVRSGDVQVVLTPRSVLDRPPQLAPAPA